MIMPRSATNPATMRTREIARGTVVPAVLRIVITTSASAITTQHSGNTSSHLVGRPKCSLKDGRRSQRKPQPIPRTGKAHIRAASEGRDSHTKPDTVQSRLQQRVKKTKPPRTIKVNKPAPERMK